MATPTLLLNIEQGPKAGSRLECKAAAIATVGRARGSTLQISRDPGISQKHICFQWSDDDDDAHVGWTAMDVGSSNGTVINGVLVEPLKELYIHTGDLIKIGSETTIRVEILGVADEGMAVPKAKECSKKKGTCIASESHGNAMTGRHAHNKAGRRAAGKSLAAHKCQGKQLDVMEGEVYHGKHIVVDEGHDKLKDGKTDEVHLGKQNSNFFEGEGQLDSTAGIVFSGNNHTNLAADGNQRGNLTTYIRRQGKHDINEHHREKHGVNNTGNDKQDNTAKVESTSRDHEDDAKNVMAASADIDYSMTVEQWFQHLMEEGPKYLHQVAESIIQDIRLESKQFDEYVLSLS